jgi:bacterioferritin
VTRLLGDKDPTTRRMLEEILADIEEEEHADEMADLLERRSTVIAGQT